MTIAAGRRFARAQRAAIGVSLVSVALASCLDRPIGSPEPITTNLLFDDITLTAVDKIDLLFMIDNSRSMADKQDILRLAVPDLVARLVNPVCVDALGNTFDPPPPGGRCPTGQNRQFNPVDDINVAIISSSLGDSGANDVCPPAGLPQHLPEGVDMAHTLGSLARGRGNGTNAHGFLEWRRGTDLAQFNSNFERLVQRVGEAGCGFEASLESWYRFLVDPFPYRELVRVPCPGGAAGSAGCVEPATDANRQILLDEELLAQRAAFLRPDSLVAVIMLTDENDCSIRVGGNSWQVAQVYGSGAPMYRGSSACDDNPNAECCYTCGQRPPEGCTPDPVCEEEPEDGFAGRLLGTEDGTNLRCFDQKRRFGIDLLYPTSRYVNALRQRELCWNTPDLSLDGCPAENRVPNPLYAGGRNESLVFLGGIVGVPWQRLASSVDSSGDPLRDPNTQLRYKTARELEEDDTWAAILGSPGVPWSPARDGQPESPGLPPLPPTDPLMIESTTPRANVARGNPINGREYPTDQESPGTPNDLQYACIFPLPEPIVCSGAAGESCDCKVDRSGRPLYDRPLCEEEPGESAAGTTQYWSKAYPGLRHLQVLHDYGENSIVASICARNVDITTRDTRADFGYRPAILSIVERLGEQLGNRCLSRSLRTEPDGTVACTLVEALPNPTAPCECDETLARRRPDPELMSRIRSELAAQEGEPCGADDPSCSGACLCEVLQVQEVEGVDAEAALRACREDPAASGFEGWCYVADTPEQKIGSPDLVSVCRPTERRLLRFAGGGLQNNSTTFVSCVGISLATPQP